MSTQVGSGGIYGLATLALGIASLSGYVSPKQETLGLTGQADFTEELGQTGDVDQIVGANKGVSCQFRFKPRGSSFANARLSLGIPNICAGVTITGLDIIACFGFTDVFNTNGGNTQPWIFTGEFNIEGTHTGLWTANMTLRRYLLITSATAIA
jgi:hypothetical protein